MKREFRVIWACEKPLFLEVVPFFLSRQGAIDVGERCVVCLLDDKPPFFLTPADRLFFLKLPGIPLSRQG